METLYETLTHTGLPMNAVDRVMEENDHLKQQVELLYSYIEDLKHRQELEIELESVEIEIPLPPKKRFKM